MMYVTKRDTTKEACSFDKVLRRIQNLSHSLDVNAYQVAQSVCARIYDGVLTSVLDEFAAITCSSLIIENPDYSKLAARIVISNHHKQTKTSYYETSKTLFAHAFISKEVFHIIETHRYILDSVIDYDRDYDFEYFGFTTLYKGYLMKKDGIVIERPQHLYMRVAIGIHLYDVDAAIDTYHMLSKKMFTHATPTLFQAATNRPQLSSCFLTAIESDSIAGIYKTLGECAMISKFAGGIGMHVSNVRSRNSIVRGTNGVSSGIIPMLRVFNTTARYANQCGRRPGSIAVFLEPWHADVMEFLDLRKNHGNEEERTRDLFTAMWIPDLFMSRVKNDQVWSLMCPDTCKGLQDVHSAEFEALYQKYENAKMYVRQIPAKEIWMKILESQIENGLPYIGYKDHVNQKNNQSNIGIIRSSNLCMEINQVSTGAETACCNLASICLPSFIKKEKFDFELMHSVVKKVVKNLNKIIDINFYPIDKARVSNMNHRPIGVGVQGLADTFAILHIPFDSDAAKTLNIQIFETIYHASLESSIELSEILGPYSSFQGSPASRGILQFDMWNVIPSGNRYDWNELKKRVVSKGLRNSLLVAPMPTASTSQICSFNECFEPFTSNIYKRKTGAGEFLIVNKYLVKELKTLGLWTDQMRKQIISAEGSVQGMKEIPQQIQDIFKTCWEIKQKVLIDMSADRGAFVCQSQSLNLFLETPTFRTLNNMHFYSHSKGLKTGIYYLRSQSRAKTQKFTIEPRAVNRKTECTDEVCLTCSS